MRRGHTTINYNLSLNLLLCHKQGFIVDMAMQTWALLHSPDLYHCGNRQEEEDGLASYQGPARDWWTEETEREETYVTTIITFLHNIIKNNKNKQKRWWVSYFYNDVTQWWNWFDLQILKLLFFFFVCFFCQNWGLQFSNYFMWWVRYIWNIYSVITWKSAVFSWEEFVLEQAEVSSWL